MRWAGPVCADWKSQFAYSLNKRLLDAFSLPSLAPETEVHNFCLWEAPVQLGKQAKRLYNSSNFCWITIGHETKRNAPELNLEAGVVWQERGMCLLGQGTASPESRSLRVWLEKPTRLTPLGQAAEYTGSRARPPGFWIRFHSLPAVWTGWGSVWVKWAL